MQGARHLVLILGHEMISSRRYTLSYNLSLLLAVSTRSCNAYGDRFNLIAPTRLGRIELFVDRVDEAQGRCLWNALGRDNSQADRDNIGRA